MTITKRNREINDTLRGYVHGKQRDTLVRLGLAKVDPAEVLQGELAQVRAEYEQAHSIEERRALAHREAHLHERLDALRKQQGKETR